MVRLCRDTNLVGPAQRELNQADIHLPAAVVLGDFGRPGESIGDLEIILQTPVVMGPGVGCVVVAGTISPLSEVRSVSPQDGRKLEIEGIAKPDGNLNVDIDLPKSWIWATDIHGTVERQFK